MLARATAIITLIGLIGGGIYLVEARYAHQAVVASLSKRLEKKIKDDEVYYTQRRIWQLQDRFGDDCGKAKSECRELKRKMQSLKGGR